MSVLVLREGIFVDARPWCRRELCLDAVIVEHDLVVAGSGLLDRVVEAGAVAILRMFSRSWVKLQIANSGHKQDIAQVGMAGPA